jgi:hypothetical protein
MQRAYGCRRGKELVYLAMKTGQIDPAHGTKLAYVLRQLGKLIVESDLERRL